MLLDQLKQFHSIMKECSDLSKFDQELLVEIEEYCIKRSGLRRVKSYAEVTAASIEPNENDKRFILNLFIKRREKTKDTLQDYTICSSDINKAWVKFSQELEEPMTLTYVQILFPDVTNSMDGKTALSRYKDPLGFYLAEDGKTLCLTHMLLERVMNGRFTAFRLDKQLLAYPLTIAELRRLHLKQGKEHAFVSRTFMYDGIWDYVLKQLAPNWNKAGRCPRVVVADLFILINNFFADPDSDLTLFRQNLLLLIDHTLYHADEINAFYGQKIRVNRRDVFLVEILLDCLEQNRETLTPKLKALASWLRSYDASFVVGESTQYSCDDFTADLLQLRKSVQSGVAEEIDQLITTISVDGALSKKHIDTLQSIYSARWQKIMGSSEDYTSTQDDLNLKWISIAQKLSGAGLIPANYYLFLMPSLESDIDVVTSDSTRWFSLSDCIVSENSRRLIYLPHCVQHLKSCNVFYVPGTPPRPLTTIEQTRIYNNHPQYRSYLTTYENNDFKPLSLKAILALRKLVNRSLYPEGLKLLYDYSEEQLFEAARALNEFYVSFYDTISDEERKNLDRHPIIFNGDKRSFAEIMQDIKNEACIAVSCQWFLQLVVDYLPEIRFSDSIEQKAHVTERRIASQGYFLKNDEFILYQLKILYCSLLTRKFTGSTQLISAYGYENAVPSGVGIKIYELLKSLFEANDLGKSPEIYSQIMKLVSESLDDTSWNTYLFRSLDTTAWLTSILDQTFFENNASYSPQKLITVIPKLMPKNFQAQDLIFKRLLQSSITTADEIRFDLYFASQSKEMRSKIDASLKATASNINEENILVSMGKRLTKRLAYEGAKSEIRQGFHDQVPMIKQDIEVKISNAFVTWPAQMLSTSDLLDFIEQQVKQIGCRVNENMRNYWLKITGRCLVEHSPELQQPQVNASILYFARS